MRPGAIQYKDLATRYGGEVEVVSAITAADIVSTRFAVPAGATFDVVLSAARPTFSVVYGPRATFAMTSTESANSASVQLDGAVAAGRAGSLVPMAIATPAVLAGQLPTEVFVVTSGALVARSTAQSPSTSVTVAGDKVTVRGDTDHDGAPDLVFETTWAALVTP